MIYFMQQGKDGPIKIGVTENIVQRMIDLQVGNPEPLRLLGLILQEAELHAHFAGLHIRGEWFKSEPELLEFIETYTMDPDTLDVPDDVPETEHHEMSFYAPPAEVEKAQAFLVPPPTVDTIASARHDGNTKRNKPILTRLRLDEFCEALSKGAANGLKMRQMCGTLQCTGRRIKQWNQWAELIHPLVEAGIYNRARSEIHPDFIDEHGRLDPIKVLDALGLEEYKHLL